MTEQQEATARAHAEAEAAGDLDATMATLDPDPVYELQPIGRRLVGRDGARRYYEWFFANFMPRVAGYEVRSEWVTDEGLGQEYAMWVRTGADPSDAAAPLERFDIIGILLFGRDGLSGERLYASDRLLELMLGPVLADTVPLEPSAPPA
jgi:hypothetical protein